MFTELTEELLDLEATTKGYGGALYAAVDPGGSCCGGCCNLVLCCCCPRSAGEHDGTARGAPAGRTSRPPAAARALVARRQGP